MIDPLIEWAALDILFEQQKCDADEYLYGNSFFDLTTGRRIDPREVCIVHKDGKELFVCHESTTPRSTRAFRRNARRVFVS